MVRRQAVVRRTADGGRDRDGDGVEEDVEKKEAKQEGGGSREIRFKVNYV